MSTTLTNGLKLPDKGSVDWYADMQNNYNILDGAVGTVAEHTSQIAGKAPLVHTHTKSDITDFPAYGNAAGTICEGNDSRLSDARTPVAHTHSKADITDLLNSNFIPSANNSYDLGSSSYQWNNLYAKNYYYNGTAWGLDKANVWTGNNVFSGDSVPTLKVKNTSLDISSLPASDLGIHIDYLDKNNVVVGGWNYIKGPDGTTRLYCELATTNSNNQTIRKTLRFDTDQNGVNWQFYPSSAGIDLGTSTNQWKSVYAQTYYYNGVAWGLDNANVWTNTNTFRQNITYERTNLSHNAVNPCYILKDTELEKGTLATTHHTAYPGLWHDKNSAILGYMRFVEYSSGRQTAEIRVSNLIKNGALDPTGTEVSCTALLELLPSGEKSLIPEVNNYVNLGTSTNKWKTLNGVNPGALSLPKEEYSDVDISAQGLNWDLTGSSDNSYTPNRDGWLEIWAKRTSLPTAYISVGNAYVRQVSEATVFNFACVTCPVRNGQTYTVRILANECHVRIMKAEGNV